MSKNHTRGILAIGIICLFVGVSASSAVSVDTKSTISNNQNEECRECNEISDADLVKVERLLNRVEVYSKLLLVLSRHNPELRELSEELSSEILPLINMFNELKSSFSILSTIILCALLFSLLMTVGYFMVKFDELLYKFEPDTLLFEITLNIYILLVFNVDFLLGLLDEYCNPS